MPIVRTYQCTECFHRMEQTLSSDQWEAPPPVCPRCAAYDFEHRMQQEFKPFAITGSASARANSIAEDIIEKDYHVADIQRERRIQGTPKVRYQDAGSVPSTAGTWGSTNAALEQAIASGREVRQRYGSGLDVLQSNLKAGLEPDLIANSKRRAIRVY